MLASKTSVTCRMVDASAARVLCISATLRENTNNVYINYFAQHNWRNRQCVFTISPLTNITAVTSATLRVN